MSDQTSNYSEALFCALDQLEEISQKQPGPVAKVAFATLYAYATDPSFQPSDRLNHALRNDFPLRRDLKSLLQKQALAHMLRAAAASSGAINLREADGYRIRLTPSKADDSATYLLIQSIDESESPRLMFVQDEDGAVYRLVIDDFFEGEAQILLQSDDDIVKALRKVQSEVILR